MITFTNYTIHMLYHVKVHKFLILEGGVAKIDFLKLLFILKRSLCRTLLLLQPETTLSKKIPTTFLSD